MATKEGKAARDESSDDWEDVDCADGEMEDVQEATAGEEEEGSEESKSFVVLNGNSNLGASDASQTENGQSTSSFSVINSRT